VRSAVLRFESDLLISQSVAGSHTTGSSLVILFYYLLHNPETLHRLVQELDVQLPSAQTPVSSIYEFAGLETKLPYALACIRESFRMTPIAAMFLPCEILNPEGLEISGSHIPQGVSHSIYQQNQQ
jgi:cytochrome P450